jgi:hypothetical protein
MTKCILAAGEVVPSRGTGLGKYDLCFTSEIKQAEDTDDRQNVPHCHSPELSCGPRRQPLVTRPADPNATAITFQDTRIDMRHE